MLLRFQGTSVHFQYIDTLYAQVLREEARHLHGESTYMYRARTFLIFEGVEQLFYALSITHLCGTYHRYKYPFQFSHDLCCFIVLGYPLRAFSSSLRR